MLSDDRLTAAETEKVAMKRKCILSKNLKRALPEAQEFLEKLTTTCLKLRHIQKHCLAS